MAKDKDLTNPLAPENQTRAALSAAIAVLRERMEKLPLDMSAGGYYCDLCGSTSVQGTAWINLNTEDDGEHGELDDDTYCNDCGTHEMVRHHDAGDEPLFCKCLAESEDEGEFNTPSWRPDVGEATTCPTCKAPYTTVRPKAEE